MSWLEAGVCGGAVYRPIEFGPAYQGQALQPDTAACNLLALGTASDQTPIRTVQDCLSQRFSLQLAAPTLSPAIRDGLSMITWREDGGGFRPLRGLQSPALIAQRNRAEGDSHQQPDAAVL